MKIGLIDVDSKWPNLALMKLSAYHKSIGDSVDWYFPISTEYDRVYASKIFNYTPDFEYPQKMNFDVIKGGSGYKFNNLPKEIENTFPDYSIYPTCDYALGFTTRGCIRRCPFCIVWRKEGILEPVGDIYNFWSGQERLILLDNNLNASQFQHFEMILGQLIKHQISVDFSQGLDIRLINDDHAYLLSKVRLWKQIHFAWDNIDDEKRVRQGLRILSRRIHLRNVMFYILIGFNSTPEEDMYRVETLRELDIDSFVMPYNKADNYQRKFARWVNHKAIFKKVPWQEYRVGCGV